MVGARFLPGGTQIAVGWANGVSLHTVDSGAEQWYRPLPAPVLAFDLQPQGQLAAAALADGSLALVDIAGGQLRQVAVAPPDGYWGDVSWSPDGKTVALQYIGPGRGDLVFLIDAASGSVSQVPQSDIHEGTRPALWWTPDSTAVMVAALGADCSRILDIRSGVELLRLGKAGQCYSPYAAVWLPDGSALAVLGRAGGIDLLSPNDGKRLKTLPGNPLVVPSALVVPAAKQALFVDPAGKWIGFLGSTDMGNFQSRMPLTIWDIAKGRIAAQLKTPLDAVKDLALVTAAFQENALVMLYEGGAIARWEFTQAGAAQTSLSRIAVISPAPWSMTFSANGSRIAYTGAYGGVVVWDLESQQPVFQLDVSFAAPALSPDGKRLAVFDTHLSTQNVYDLATGELIHSLPGTKVVFGAAFSPGGDVLAYGDGARIKIARIGSRVPVTLEPDRADNIPAGQVIRRLIWSPDGQALVSQISDENEGGETPGTLILWRQSTSGVFDEVFHVANTRASYTQPNLVLAAFNPSGTRVALQSFPGSDAAQMEVVVYDLRVGGVIQTFKEYIPGAWAGDDVLLTAEAQYDIRLTRWNVVTGEKQAGAGREDLGNAYAPGGVMYMQLDQLPERGVAIKYWWTGEVLARGSLAALNMVDYRWSPDGRWIAVQGDGGSIRVWPVEWK